MPLKNRLVQELNKRLVNINELANRLQEIQNSTDVSQIQKQPLVKLVEQLLIQAARNAIELLLLKRNDDARAMVVEILAPLPPDQQTSVWNQCANLDQPLTFLVCDSNNTNIMQLLVNPNQNEPKLPWKVNHAAPRKGDTLLYYACESENLEMVKLILQAKPQVDLATTAQRTPLSIACEKGNADIVKVLIEAGADVNIADDQKRTPLLLACMQGHENVVEQLIAAGAKVDQADNKGQTPLSIARQKGHENVVKQLIAAGADVAQANNQGGAQVQETRPTSVWQRLKGFWLTILKTLGLYNASKPQKSHENVQREENPLSSEHQQSPTIAHQHSTPSSLHSKPSSNAAPK
jgi:hypothetical protein